MNSLNQRKRYLNLYRRHVSQELDALGYANEHPAPQPATPSGTWSSFRIAGLAAAALVLAAAAGQLL